MSNSTPPDRLHRPGEKLSGFTIDRVTELPDVRAVAYEATHDATGAQLLHLHADDPENLFSIGLRTPPSDSTGVPHVIEHSVLSGSERFPVKDAFNELSRGSLCTFINAMTWPDKTVYPVASPVRADFFNLATVYLDVVLHPRLSERTFAQEGHHLELEDPSDLDSPLTVSGIVYNEMKGVYSSPDSLTFKELQEALYPDNCYGVDSGGDPGVMPELTYEGFRDFHRRFYSLSNARFFLYGDITTADQLAFLTRELEHHAQERVKVDSAIADQDPWSAPRRLEHPFPVAKGESLDGKAVVNVGWMTARTDRPEDSIVLRVLSSALVGTAAGPLRMALLQSGLGEDLSSETGFDTDFKQAPFVVGLRGTERERADEIEALVLRTLERLVDEGIDEELLHGAFQQYEFASKEIGSSYPVRLMIRAFQTWNYDADPKVGLSLSSAIEDVRARWQANPRLFQDALRRWLIDNTHRLLAIAYPSDTLAEEKQAAFAERMAARRAELSSAELERIRDEAEALRIAQATPDPPEVLAKLPRVSVADIPRDARTIPVCETEIEGVKVLEHELFTSGIVYAGLSFDVAPLESELHPLLPFLGRLTSGMGAAGLSYDEMARRKALHTGGVGCGVSALRHVRDGRSVERVNVLGRALTHEAGEMAAIVRDLLIAGDLTDAKRAQDILLEMRNDARAGLVRAGHAQARLLAAAARDATSYRGEQYGGLTQARFLDESAQELETRLPALLERIGEERSRLFCRSRLVANLTGDAEGLAAGREALAAILRELPEGAEDAPSELPRLGEDRVGFALASEVSFVARVATAPDMLDPVSPGLAVLSQILADGYLYEKIRVQGGAYGGFCYYDPVGAQFGMLSYRDPNLLDTLEVYDRIVEAARAPGGIDEALVEKSIIATIGGYDAILDPCTKGMVGMRRYLLGITDEDRRRYRDGLLAVTREGIVEEALPVLEDALARAAQAVVSSREVIEEANRSLEPGFSIRSLD